MDKYVIGCDIDDKFDILNRNDNIIDIKDIPELGIQFITFDETIEDDIDNEDILIGEDMDEVLADTLYSSFNYSLIDISSFFEDGSYILFERIGEKLKAINFGVYKPILDKYINDYNKIKDFFLSLEQYVTQYATLTISFDEKNVMQIELVNKNVDDIKDVRRKFKEEHLNIREFETDNLIFSHSIEFLTKEVVFELPYYITMGLTLRTTLKDSEFNKIHGYAFFIDDYDDINLLKATAEQVKDSFNTVHEKEVYCGETDDDVICGFDII